MAGKRLGNRTDAQHRIPIGRLSAVGRFTDAIGGRLAVPHRSNDEPGNLVLEIKDGAGKLDDLFEQRVREYRARRANRNACRHKQGERRIPHAANCDVSHVVRLPENWARTMHATARNR